MTTWVLLIFLTYSGGEMGGTALEKEKVEFFSREDCFNARTEQKREFKEAGFLRFTVTCHKRTGPLMEPEKASK